jgi:phage terminase Nu1 subunit (DNA packaging protein)
MPVNLITQAEYARHRGVDPTTVRDAIRAGRITLIDGKVDPVAADAQWARNTRARVGSGQRPARDAGAGEGASAAAPQPGESYEAARRRRELAEAQLAELKLAELRGELVRVAAVRTQVAKLAAGLREGLMQIPARLAPVLAAETDAGQVHDQLVRELRQVLEQVTDHDAPEPGALEH